MRDDRSVTFNYRDSGDSQRKAMTLPAHEFLRRFLQHVPRKGLHRVRAFGLLHPALGQLDKREMIKAALTAPLHPGAERYYKEVGLIK